MSRWYLRSAGVRDIHLAGELPDADGTVTAHCGVVFQPLQRDHGPVLPGDPPGPELVCLRCCRVMPG